MQGRPIDAARKGTRLVLTGLTVFLVLGVVGAGTPQGSGGPGGKKKIAAGLRVDIEVLPGQSEKVVDPTLHERVAVAVLGSPAFDARNVDPASIVLSGAPITKQDDGRLSTSRDVNHDGRPDLVFEVSSGQLRLGERSTRAFLTGRTLDGQHFHGSGSVRTVEGVRAEGRRKAHPNPALEKLPPLPVEIDILPRDPANRIELGNRGTLPVAILSSRGFDATALDPTTLSLAGSPVTRSRRGGMAAQEDVNGDGRTDLVVEVPKKALRLGAGSTEAVLTALTPEGRFIQGADKVQVGDTATMTFSSDDRRPPSPPAQPEPEFLSTSAIFINDNAPAAPYPSIIPVAGLRGVISKVRVTLKGLTHAFPNDIDLLLVGPTGQSIILMSDTAGPGPVAGITLTFDDDAAQSLDPTIIGFTGTYRPSNFGPGDPFPPPAPIPTPAPTLSVFNGTRPNGQWQLYVLDDAPGSVGRIDSWSIDFVMAAEFFNAAPITINDNAPAAPYPSTILIPDLTGVVSKVTLTLKGLSHTFPNDIDLLLVGPTGQSVLAMSDAGGAGPGVSNVTLVLDDNSPLFLDPAVNPVTATYEPMDFNDGLADLFPPPAPPGPYSTLFSAFNGTGPNGTWSLYVLDDAGTDTGVIAQGWSLIITTMTPVDASNPGNITIPSGAPGVTAGPADPYPSNIFVSGVIGNISKATVTLNSLSHTFPQDLDILLTGPAGQNVMLMSDVGGGGPGVAGITMTFDDDVPAVVPGAANPVSGSYKPTNDDSGGPDALPAPAPVGPYGPALSVLGGANPNGVWSLFVFDDAGGDVGALAAGWSVTITTLLPGAGFCNFTPLTIPAGAPGVTSGAASLYPSNISIPPLPGELDQYKVRVTLLALTHSYPDDLDVLLVGPGGQNVMLMSDAGGFGPGVTNVTFSFDDDATAQLPDNANPPGGSYKPTDVFDGPDPLPGPAPGPPYGRSMASFKGTNSSGTWSLYIVDDASGDTGSLANGWCVEFLPSITAAEVPNLRWRNDTTVMWDAGPNATSYNLYRGDPPVIRSLQDPAVDSCLRGTSLVQEITGLIETPLVGNWYWYLLRGNNAQGEGHPGFMLLGTQPLARIQDSSGSCP